MYALTFLCGPSHDALRRQRAWVQRRFKQHKRVCAVKNKEYIDWVRKEVKALQYDTDERVITTAGFDALEQGRAGDQEPVVVLMTQTSPDRSESLFSTLGNYSL